MDAITTTSHWTSVIAFRITRQAKQQDCTTFLPTTTKTFPSNVDPKKPINAWNFEKKSSSWELGTGKIYSKWPVVDELSGERADKSTWGDYKSLGNDCGYVTRKHGLY